MWIRAALLALAVAAGGCGDEPETEVLVFSRTTAYRHADAIEAGRRCGPLDFACGRIIDYLSSRPEPR